MVRKASCILSTFSGCNPHTLTLLFQSHCLSLYGGALWSLSSSALLSLEVSFNNILRKIWKLPRNSHTGIVHQTAKLPRLFNVIHDRYRTLLNSAVSNSLLQYYVIVQSLVILLLVIIHCMVSVIVRSITVNMVCVPILFVVSD